METAGSFDPISPLAPAPKRRKLRKGTSSCWECKRRKARCTFAEVANDVCDGCKRRGTPCISQDLPDQPTPSGSNRHLVDRLGQVEALVGRLLRGANDSKLPSAGSPSPSPHQGDARTRAELSVTQPLRATTASEAPGVDPFLPRGQSNRDYPKPVEKNRLADTSPHRSRTTTATLATTPILSEEDTQSSSRYYGYLCRELLTAWPMQKDLDIILSVPVETFSVVRGVTCITPPDNSTDFALPSPQTFLQLPPSGSHPVLIAQKLLVLGAYLQGIPSSSFGDLENLSISRQDIMSRIIQRTHNLVTCNDELATSIEGVECIMLEALYENYSGNLRRAWLASRRAITIAQMLGLHQGVKLPSLIGATSKPDYVWFRLVQLDRYLSMILSLPQASLDDSYARLEVLEPCIALERMQRLNCVAAGRLLRRNPADFYDSAMTKEIDKLLADASASLPAQWWATPILSSRSSSMDKIHEMLRFNSHFMHYHLLVQLHLPYLLRPEPPSEYEYNRMTAITASREILTRFLSFRTLNTVECYCRGVDFLAFVASTALGLAHICSRRQLGEYGTGFHFLAHQRLSDRGLLEHTLQSMQKIARENRDAIATAVATLLENLLSIEEDAAAGGSYTVTSCPESREEDEPVYSVRLSNDGAVLDIHLPHIKAIKIERNPHQTERLPTMLNHHHITPHDHCLEATTQYGRGRKKVQASTDDRDGRNMSTSPIWQNPSLI